MTEDYNNFFTKTVTYDKLLDARLELLKKIVGKVGKGSLVEPPFRPDYGCNIFIGEECSINFGYLLTSFPSFSFSFSFYPLCFILYISIKTNDMPPSLTVLDTSLVIIGDRVQMGPNVSIYTATHDTSVLSRRKYVEFGHPVRIGDDCWIGGNVIILPGVTIGEGTTIAAGSIVTKDIPPFSVAMGSPCRVKRTIKSAEEEEKDPDNVYRNLPGRYEC